VSVEHDAKAPVPGFGGPIFSPSLSLDAPGLDTAAGKPDDTFFAFDAFPEQSSPGVLDNVGGPSNEFFQSAFDDAFDANPSFGLDAGTASSFPLFD